MIPNSLEYGMAIVEQELPLDLIAPERPSARRRVMKFGFALVGFGVASVVRADRAGATWACGDYSCCCLWYTDCGHTCSTNSNNGSVICPSGSYLKSWYCCYQYNTWRCSECKSQGSYCTDNLSSIKCSKAVYLGATCGSFNDGC